MPLRYDVLSVRSDFLSEVSQGVLRRAELALRLALDGFIPSGRACAAAQPGEGTGEFPDRPQGEDGDQAPLDDVDVGSPVRGCAGCRGLALQDLNEVGSRLDGSLSAECGEVCPSRLV